MTNLYSYGTTSRKRLDTCDPDLQRIFDEVIKHIDVAITEGERGKELQNKYFAEGKSKLRYPEGKHNKTPSQAVDAIPYPVDWKDKERFIRFAYFVMGIAAGMDIELRWGGDWDRDFDLEDQRFNDYPHFELVGR